MNLRAVCATLLYFSSLFIASVTQLHYPARNYKMQASAISGQQLPLSSGSTSKADYARFIVKLSIILR
jgi:hydrogenase-4 membrane subunit HyfE